MNTLFTKLGSLISKNPFKVLLITLVVFGIMIGGVSQMQMATGNNTLVQEDNSVYIVNEKMENTFGGDSILILLESEADTLLTVETMKSLYAIEQELDNHEHIFTIMSPATLVHEITKRQSEQLVNQIEFMSEGLDTMGTSMLELSHQLTSVDVPDTKVMVAKLNELDAMSAKFESLATGQNNIAMNVNLLGGGLNETSNGLKQVSSQLQTLAKDQPEALATTLNTLALKLTQSANGLSGISDQTSTIQEGATSTAIALETIQSTLESELSQIKESFSKGLSKDKLNEMTTNFQEMGNQLIQLSQGLATIHAKSAMMEPTLVSTQEELEFILYDESEEVKDVFEDVIIQKNQAMMVVKLTGNLSDEQKDDVTAIIQAQFDKADLGGVNTTISGKTVLDSALKSEMKTSMMMMVGFAILIMLLVLLVIFNVTWRMLSLGVVFVAVIATLGFMGWVDVPITMVSMAVFPILIGLGIDYSIQFHNRFEEEQSSKQTVKHIGKAVAIAVFATILGFISLYASPVPMIQDFGKMLTLGVAISFLGSLFILLPILKIGKLVNAEKVKDKPKRKPTESSWISKKLVQLTRFTIRFKYVIVVTFVLLAGAGFYSDQFVGVETNVEEFMPQDLPALEDIHTIRDAVMSSDQLIVYIENDNVLSKESIDWMNDTHEMLMSTYASSVVSVKSIDTLITSLSSEEVVTYDEKMEALHLVPDKQQASFVSEDHQEALMIVNINMHSSEETKLLIDAIAQDIEDDQIQATLTGKTVLDVEMVDGLTSGRVTMTLLGLGLVFAALLLLYRNVFKALIPLIPVSLIIGVSSGLMYLLNIDFTPITATLGALVLGMGTEMTIMVLERYLEERQQDRGVHQSIETAIASIGKAILASGLTTVGGFSVLMFSSFVILQDFGLMTMINISLALFSTFIVLPPVIVLFDRWITPKPKA